MTPPASAQGTVFVATLNAPDTLHPDQTAYFGGKTGTMPGEVVALDARSGHKVWDTHVPGDPTGGITLVNNLVLTATLQGFDPRPLPVIREDRLADTGTREESTDGCRSSGEPIIVPVGLEQSADHLGAPPALKDTSGSVTAPSQLGF